MKSLSDETSLRIQKSFVRHHIKLWSTETQTRTVEVYWSIWIIFLLIKEILIVTHEFFQVPNSILQHRVALAVGEFSKYKNRTILQIMHNLPQWEQPELVSSYLLGSSTRFLAFDLRQLQHRIICNFSCLLIWRYVHMCNYGIY